MEKRLKRYLAAMDELLAALEAGHSDHVDSTKQNTDVRNDGVQNADAQTINDLLREHLTQIQFFQHERLIHLIVTCLFAVLAFAAFFALFFTMNAGLFVLFAALLVLLIPYIRHYYILENGVQRMYTQYDRLRKLIHSCP